MSALPNWLFDNFLFHPWPGRWLDHDRWHLFCVGLCIALALVAAGLFMLEDRLRRLGSPLPRRWVERTCLIL
ncbi:MAG TPA: hypothetical protein VG963_14805, partial [Polyangiaceae bacterium]|nr:hypothetical protein [Polyangiaceae bacterium]